MPALKNSAFCFSRIKTISLLYCTALAPIGIVMDKVSLFCLTPSSVAQFQEVLSILYSHWTRGVMWHAGLYLYILVLTIENFRWKFSFSVVLEDLSTYELYRTQFQNTAILLEWLVLHPLRCYFSADFTQLMGRSQKFNSYPLGEIFQCCDKNSIQNHKSQWFHDIYPKQTLVEEISNVTNCHKSVLIKQNLSIESNNLFSHL